jgi:hypothetical protein
LTEAQVLSLQQQIERDQQPLSDRILADLKEIRDNRIYPG